MFDALTKSVDNALAFGTGLVDFLNPESAPTRQQIAKLIADGATVVAIAGALDWSTDQVEELLNSED